MVLHRILYEHHQRIGKELLTRDTSSRAAYEAICTILVEKGDPVTLPKNLLSLTVAERLDLVIDTKCKY